MNQSEYFDYLNRRTKRVENDKKQAQKDFNSERFQDGMSEEYYVEYGALQIRHDNIKET